MFSIWGSPFPYGDYHTEMGRETRIFPYGESPFPNRVCFHLGINIYSTIIVVLLNISLSGRWVFDSQSIRLSETVLFRKNHLLVPTYISTYDVLLNFRLAEMAGNLIIAKNSDPGICDWLTQWFFTQITSSSVDEQQYTNKIFMTLNLY